MPTLDERVAYLEGRLEEHSGSVAALRGDIGELRRQSESLDQKFDRHFHALDIKIGSISVRLDSRIDALDTRASRHFTWLVGIQVAVLIAIVSALAR